MKTLRHSQTQEAYGSFGLPMSAGVTSPYFRIGRNTQIIPRTMAINAFIFGYAPNSTTLAVDVLLEDSTGTYTSATVVPIATGNTDSSADILALIEPAVDAFIFSNLGVHPASIVWLFNTNLGPTSYQTIVSQTGTAAPAISGGFTPTNTYAAGTTFTWARTGAGVYTLTASAAVFNTSKTGVFIAPLQNLNASVRGVVTSSTVITVTTAVQSVAILGLLGLTTTSTDALLNGTMIYVQTYS